MPGAVHKECLADVILEYKAKGYAYSDDADALFLKLHSLGWYPDFVMANSEEIVVIEIVVTSDRCKSDILHQIQPLFLKPIRLDKRVVMYKKVQISIGMKTLKISDSVHEELRKIKGALMASNGKDRSFDDVIAELIKFWKEKKA